MGISSPCVLLSSTVKLLAKRLDLIVLVVLFLNHWRERPYSKEVIRWCDSTAAADVNPFTDTSKFALKMCWPPATATATTGGTAATAETTNAADDATTTASQH